VEIRSPAWENQGRVEVGSFLGLGAGCGALPDPPKSLLPIVIGNMAK
jgi:hypothetical protein